MSLVLRRGEDQPWRAPNVGGSLVSHGQIVTSLRGIYFTQAFGCEHDCEQTFPDDLNFIRMNENRRGWFFRERFIKLVCERKVASYRFRYLSCKWTIKKIGVHEYHGAQQAGGRQSIQ